MTNRQRLFALLAPSGVLLVAWLLLQARPTTAALWIIGVLLGSALYRTRFCVAAAFRDPVLFRDTGLARAVLLALALSSVTFGWMQYRAGAALPGNLYPISAATIAGAILFGMGIVPAGGCACSTILRIGEGNRRYLWTLAGLIAGSVLGAYHYPWWEALLGATAPLHMPALLGWPLALLLQFGGLGGLLWLVTWWERKGSEWA